MINGTDGQDEVISKTTNRKPWKKIIASAMAVTGLAWISLPTLSQWLGGVSSVDGQSVTRATVFKGTLVRDIAVSGKLVAVNAPTLYSSESGQVISRIFILSPQCRRA